MAEKGFRLGIKHPLPPVSAGWSEGGEHASNPLVGSPDVFPYFRFGGEETGIGMRSRVEHYSVDRQRMIAHPLGGPHPARCGPEEDGVS